MRTTKTQDTPSTRTRFQYKPDRHYVLAEKESRDWDGSTMDQLLNETLPDGSDAYEIEADGSRSSEERRQTGGARMTLLSCPKDYADEKAAMASHQSKANATAIAPETEEEFERLSNLAAISFDNLPNTAEIEAKRFAP
jgi:hypothetical protein